MEAGGLQGLAEADEVGQAVEFAALFQSTAPGEDGGHGVGGSGLALEVLVVVAGDGAVGGFELELAVRADENAGHHGQGAEGGGDHVAHDVAVVVLAGPDEAALAADDAGHDVVDEAVEVFQTGGLEPGLVFGVVDLLEDVLEGVVVFLGDGILGTEPEVLLLVQRVVEAAAGEAADGAVLVVLALQDAAALEVVDGGGLLGAVRAGEAQLRFAGAGDAELGGLVDVAVGVAGDGDGLLPVLDGGLDAVDHNGRTEDRAVQRSADGAVGALPHLMELVLLHPLGVGGDGGALDGHAVFLVGLGGVEGHLVAGGVTVGQAEVIILGLEVHERQDELVLDDLPEHTGHLVAVHLHQRGRHLDLFHSSFPFLSIITDGYLRPRRHCQLYAGGSRFICGRMPPAVPVRAGCARPFRCRCSRPGAHSL